MINDPNQFALEWFLRFTAPLAIYTTGAELFNLPKHKEQAAKLGKAAKQGERICELFKAFTKKEYYFDTTTIQRWTNQARKEMSSSVAKQGYVAASNIFNVDSTEIVWNTYLQCFAYGIRRYILAEDMTDFPHETLLHNDLQLTTQNIIDWDHDHHGKR